MNCTVAPSFLWSKFSRQRWTILNKSDRIKGIFNFSRNEIILFETNPMLFIVWIFWIGHLHEVDRKICFIICLLCIHARREKTWRQVAKNMIKKNNSLDWKNSSKRANQLIPFVVCTSVDLNHIDILIDSFHVLFHKLFRTFFWETERAETIA